MSKRLYRSIILKGDCDEQTNETFLLEYYILETETEILSNQLYMHTYGVEIIKKFIKDNMITCEKKSISDILYSDIAIIEFIDILVRNEVTPSTLEEVVDDLLGDSIELISELKKEA